MRRFVRVVLVLMVAALAMGSFGCSGKEAASAALATAQTAFDAVKGPAANVLPEETAKLNDAFVAAKSNLEAGKFKEAMEAAKALPAQVQQLADAAAKKKEELTTSWNSVSTELPGAIATVQTKVDELSKAKRLPAGLDTAKLSGIKASLAEVTQMWSDAQAAFQTGNLAGALAKVGTLKPALASAMTALGIPVPAMLQAS